MKILEENRIQSIQNNLIYDTEFGNDFLVWHQKHRSHNQKYTKRTRSNLKRWRQYLQIMYLLGG